MYLTYVYNLGLTVHLFWKIVATFVCTSGRQSKIMIEEPLACRSTNLVKSILNEIP